MIHDGFMHGLCIWRCCFLAWNRENLKNAESTQKKLTTIEDTNDKKKQPYLNRNQTLTGSRKYIFAPIPDD